MADLTRDDVLRLARLARLQVTEAEVTDFQKDLAEILGYVEQLGDVTISGLEPTSQVTSLVNVTRSDEIIDYGYNALDLLNNVPNVEANQIKVKRMIV